MSNANDAEGRPWRELRFVYAVPPDVEDVVELETQMIEHLAEMIGCECDEGSTGPCNASWVGSIGPLSGD